MTRRSARFLFGGLLFVASGAASATCFAGLQQPQATPPKATDAQPQSKVDTSQKSADPGDNHQDQDNSLGLHLIQHLAKDQEAIWTAPARIRLVDADWLVPFGLAAAGMFATDTEFSKHLSNSPSRLRNSTNFSNYGIGAMGGLAGGLYLWGQFARDEHKRETGVLAGEAALDSLGVVYALKYSLGRERPLQDERSEERRVGKEC